MSQARRIENIKRWESYIGKEALIRERRVADEHQKGMPASTWKNYRGTVSLVYYDPHIKAIHIVCDRGRFQTPLIQCVDPSRQWNKTEIYIEGLRIV